MWLVLRDDAYLTIRNVSLAAFECPALSAATMLTV
jgi:hypothetical protein